MEFIKYPSIENLYSLDTTRYNPEFSPCKWIIQEKIHGANLSLWISPTEIRIASRNQFLKDDDNFYGFQKIKPTLEKYAEAIRQNVYEHLHFYPGHGGREIIVYGELFGGCYPHESVQKSNAKAIQKGVYYHPDTQFAMFDIVVYGMFLPSGILKTIASQTGVPIVPILAVDEWNIVKSYSNSFQTEIPNMFGLPAIANNICEGIVIKQDEFKLMDQRITFKNKNEKWSEKAKEVKPPREAIPEEELKQFEELSKLITVNRLNNVLSKIVGDRSIKNFSEIIKTYYEDVSKECSLDSVPKSVNKLLSKAMATLIREQLTRHNVIE